MICYAFYNSPMGKLLLTGDGYSLTGLFTGNYEIPERGENTSEGFEKVFLWLDAYFRGEISDPEFSIRLDGTPFQMQVWEILKTIPYGKVITYGDIAREMALRMDKPKMSAQAVGGAVGRNPISIIIPCHRVIGASQRLTGYAGGLDKKRWLLLHEGYTKFRE